MGHIVIACYRPKPNKAEALRALMKTHVPRLRAQNLVTERESIVMVAEDGTILEVFEWRSKQAVETAHTNPEVQKMWQEYEAVCEYVPLKTLAEAGQMFATFAPLELD